MNVLFVCTGNTCRSPMAEGIFTKLVTDMKLMNMYASSAGTFADNSSRATKNAILACKQIGVDLSKHISKNISDVNLNEFDKFIVMTNLHRDFLCNLGVDEDKIYILGDQIQDPYGGNIEVYEKCCDQIYNALLQLINNKNFIGEKNA